MRRPRPIAVASPAAHFFLALFGAALVTTSSTARADEPTAPPSDEARGWETRPGTAREDVALFVPRLVTTVPRLVLTLAFLPLQHGLRFLSRQLASSAPPPDGRAHRRVAVLPHLSYASGFGANVGVAAQYSNLAGNDEEASLAAGYGGTYAPFGEVAFRADRTAGTQLWLESLTRYEVKPQAVFQGIGDGPAPESRFREERLVVAERAGLTLGGARDVTRVGGGVIFEGSSFGARTADSSGSPSIEQIYDTAALPGFQRGAKTLEAQANLFVDTRDAAAAPSSGVVAAAFAGAVPGVDGYAYAHVGADVSGVVDLYKKSRVLVLRAALEGVHGGRDDVPFSRLARLGGADNLRGYRPDRFRDRDAALVSVEYRYPIHDVVAGALFVDAGHVAPDPARLTALDRWRAGVGLGLRIRTDNTTLATLDVAYGDGVQLMFGIFPFAPPNPRMKP